MKINIKYLLFIFLLSFNIINSHIIQYGREIQFDNVTSKDNQIYNTNSNKVILVNGGNGVYHLVDKQVFEIVETFEFKEEKELQVNKKSAYFDETKDNFYIVLGIKNESKSILYKLDKDFSVVSSFEIVNEQVSSNQYYTLNFEKSTGLITFIGERGIHRFEYEGNTTKVYAAFIFKNRHRGFKLSTISYNNNILYIGGSDHNKPVLMKFYLSHYGSGKRIQYLDSLIKLNEHVASISNLLVYKNAVTFISKLKSDSVYYGPSYQLNVFGFDDSFKIGVGLQNLGLSSSDGNHIGLYIKNGSEEEDYNGRDLIYAIKIKEENYRNYAVEVVSISYYRDDSAITSVYYAGENKFIITTNTSTIQMIEVDSTKPNDKEIVPYSPQPNHHHNKLNNKWWRILFAAIITGTGLFLCCGIVSLYIFIKKRDVITQFLKSNGFYKDGADSNNNNNDDSSNQFASTILFEKYQKLNSDNTVANENENEKIDIDSNNTDGNNDDSSSSNGNSNNNNNNDNNNSNNCSGSHQSYQL